MKAISLFFLNLRNITLNICRQKVYFVTTLMTNLLKLYIYINVKKNEF
jgi:hypothetical protein